jgi:pyridoxine 5-phosphate synthase
VSPEPEAVKAAHGLGFRGVELFSGGLVDLPPDERRRELDRLADAVRLASKLRVPVSLGGSLGFTSVRELLAVAPSIERVACGRALIERSLLVGMDRAVRDFLALLR